MYSTKKSAIMAKAFKRIFYHNPVSVNKFYSQKPKTPLKAPPQPPPSQPPPLPPPPPPPSPTPQNQCSPSEAKKEQPPKKFQTRDSLMHTVTNYPAFTGHKVTVVGVGAVGMACAFSVLTQNVSNELALIDKDPKKLEGEVLDLQHGSTFIRNARIYGSPDYEVSAGSKVCIIAAGVRQEVGESRLNLIQRNTDIFKDVIPQLMKHSPDAIIVVASNPVDVLTYVAWRLSGLPSNRVVGAGTNLDSSRFRFLISQRLGVAPASVHGWIIGEHGDSSVAVWSGVNVAGVRLAELNPNIGTESDPENWSDVHQRVVKAGGYVHKLKGYTNWAIGLNVSSIAKSIIGSTNQVHACSTLATGIHGIEKDCYMALPGVVNSNGVTQIIKQILTKNELEKLHKSANIMYKVQDGINWC